MWFIECAVKMLYLALLFFNRQMFPQEQTKQVQMFLLLETEVVVLNPKRTLLILTVLLMIQLLWKYILLATEEDMLCQSFNYFFIK
mgnify:CR=1 FL=1